MQYLEWPGKRSLHPWIDRIVIFKSHHFIVRVLATAIFLIMLFLGCFSTGTAVEGLVVRFAYFIAGRGVVECRRGRVAFGCSPLYRNSMRTEAVAHVTRLLISIFSIRPSK
jgi:hypothetical protein